MVLYSCFRCIIQNLLSLISARSSSHSRTFYLHPRTWILDCPTLLCTSVYFCSPPLMAESAPDHPSLIQPVVLLLLPAWRQWCISLSFQDLFPWSASAPTDYSATLVQSWQGFYKKRLLQFPFFSFSFFLLSFFICTVSDVCCIAMYMPMCTMDITRLPGCLCGPLQACQLCFIIFSDIHVGFHCDVENDVAALTGICLYVLAPFIDVDLCYPLLIRRRGQIARSIRWQLLN